MTPPGANWPGRLDVTDFPRQLFAAYVTPCFTTVVLYIHHRPASVKNALRFRVFNYRFLGELYKAAELVAYDPTVSAQPLQGCLVRSAVGDLRSATDPNSAYHPAVSPCTMNSERMQYVTLVIRGLEYIQVCADTDASTGTMDPTEWFRKCACGQAFYKPNSFSNHINSCKRYKKDLGKTLENAKVRYAAKAKQKKGKLAIDSWYGDASLDIDHDISLPQGLEAETSSQAPEHVGAMEEPEGRGFRIREPTQRYRDFLVTSAIPLAVPMFGEAIKTPPNSHPQLPAVCPHCSAPVFWTTENQPHDPDLFVPPVEFEDDDEASQVDLGAISAIVRNKYHPFPNWSSFMLGSWFWDDRSGKSRESFERLVEVITDPDFKPDDIRKANWRKVGDALASSDLGADIGQEDTQWVEDGASWTCVSVAVDVPFNTTSACPGSASYVVEGFRFRPLVPIILSKLKDLETSDHFHIVPSELRWQPGESDEGVRVYGDLYHSDAFLEAYREVQVRDIHPKSFSQGDTDRIFQLLPPEASEDDLPRCVVALMFSSDETMLTSFGHAKLWPVYLCFGNDTKYRRGKVSLKLFEEVAYLQHLPDAFHDWFLQRSGKKVVGEPLLSHLRRELFHGQWKMLLDDEFVQAYEHGLIVDCNDGVRRRFYPRILTYSTDYPERVTVVGVRNLGDHPCPRCLIALEDIRDMGTQRDRALRHSQKRKDDEARVKKVTTARSSIYRKNHNPRQAPSPPVSPSDHFNSLQNAFSDQLSRLGLDMYQMLAVNILHEFEIGVWKSLFIHLLRLLEAIDTTFISTLNSRFRQVPTFGRDTIRRFSKNVSDRKQFGAREYEDVLQCSIPAFEGLFPGEHDGHVQKLLYSMVHWHSFAKLRMHTDHTLDILDSATSLLGDDARTFVSSTCASFKTRELKKEYEARKRAEARKRSKGSGRGTQGTASSSTSVAIDALGPGEISTDNVDGRKDRTWNLNTPKFHGLGDVVSHIRRFGTTDSYSTQMSERFHVVPKSRYRRTNKKGVSQQLSRMQTRQARIRKLRSQLYPSLEEKAGVDTLPRFTGNMQAYFIGKSQNQPLNLSHFQRLHSDDDATKGFMHKLKCHLFPRVIEALIEEAGMQPERYKDSLARLKTFADMDSAAVSEREADNIYFHSETIYRHNILQLWYTTYDCRQDRDTLNPSTTRRDFMCIRANDTVPDSTQYVYGRLLGIFHANVLYLGPGAMDYRRRRFDFLWVRWFEPTPSPQTTASPAKRTMDRLKFIPLAQAHSWGFVDPSHVLRAAHIIPRFALGPLYGPEDGKRIFSKCARESQDWKEYYINRFADRDMVLRFYTGVAVGHSSLQDPSIAGQSRPGTPMEIDIPEVEERELAGDIYTDSEDSDYDGGQEDELSLLWSRLGGQLEYCMRLLTFRNFAVSISTRSIESAALKLLSPFGLHRTQLNMDSAGSDCGGVSASTIIVRPRLGCRAILCDPTQVYDVQCTAPYAAQIAANILAESSTSATGYASIPRTIILLPWDELTEAPTVTTQCAEVGHRYAKQRHQGKHGHNRHYQEYRRGDRLHLMSAPAWTSPGRMTGLPFATLSSDVIATPLVPERSDAAPPSIVAHHHRFGMLSMTRDDPGALNSPFAGLGVSQSGDGPLHSSAEAAHPGLNPYPRGISEELEFNDDYVKTCKLMGFDPQNLRLTNLDIIFNLGRIFGPGVTKSQFRRVMRKCSLCRNICLAERRHYHRCDGRVLDTEADGFDLVLELLASTEHAGLTPLDLRRLLSRATGFDDDDCWSQEQSHLSCSHGPNMRLRPEVRDARGSYGGGAAFIDLAVPPLVPIPSRQHIRVVCIKPSDGWVNGTFSADPSLSNLPSHSLRSPFMAALNAAPAQVIQNVPHAVIALVPRGSIGTVVAAAAPHGRAKAITVDSQNSLVVFTTRAGDWDAISIVARVSVIAKRRRVSLVPDYLPYASITAEISDTALLFLAGIFAIVVGVLARKSFVAISDDTEMSLPPGLLYLLHLASLGKDALRHTSYRVHDLFQDQLEFIITVLEGMRDAYPPDRYLDDDRRVGQSPTVTHSSELAGVFHGVISTANAARGHKGALRLHFKLRYRLPAQTDLMKEEDHSPASRKTASLTRIAKQPDTPSQQLHSSTQVAQTADAAFAQWLQKNGKKLQLRRAYLSATGDKKCPHHISVGRPFPGASIHLHDTNYSLSPDHSVATVDPLPMEVTAQWAKLVKVGEGDESDDEEVVYEYPQDHIYIRLINTRGRFNKQGLLEWEDLDGSTVAVALHWRSGLHPMARQPEGSSVRRKCKSKPAVGV
ncbi:hypothetical protein NMY22_g6101 [Coprinellus aureogranulatus]|nr:hypothetical protein NMY22_g6101 [Coprinellus aureogranulatus]